MDQQKIGRFLRELRREKGLTQEQLAERLGVTNRSVSRWETGSNLPELDLLIELADLHGVELREILDGERTRKNMNKEIEETARKVADYGDMEKETLKRRIHWIFLAAAGCFLIYMALDIGGLAQSGIAENVADLCLGFVFGILLVGALFTSRLYPRLRQLKRQWFHR